MFVGFGLRHRGWGILVGILVVAALFPPGLRGAYAQGGGEIVEISPIQVLEGFPLVSGKATVVRVALRANRASEAKLTVSFDGRDYQQNVRLQAGQQWVDVFVDPPRSAGSLTVTASLSGGASGRASVDALVVEPTRRLKIFYLPTDWTPEQRRRLRYDEIIPRFVELQTAFLEAVYPLPEDHVDADYSPAPHMVRANEKALVDASGTVDNRALSTLYGTVYLAARRQAPDADLMVAILPPDWFGTYMASPGTLGLQFKLVSGLVLAQIGMRGVVDLEGEKPIVASHEIGHVFNLEDEYDYSQSPPKRGDRIDVPGYWVIQREPKEDSSIKPTFNFMSSAGLPDYWVRSEVYGALLRTFTDWDGRSGLRKVGGGARSGSEGDLRAATVEITMAKRLNDEYEPVEPTTSYRPTEPFRASIALRNVPKGTQITARWYFESVLLREGGTTARTDIAEATLGVGLSNEEPWERGRYRLEVLLNRELKGTAEFTVR